MRISDWSSDVCSSDLRADIRVVEDRVDHFLGAVDALENAFGKAGLEHQLAEAHRHAGIALAGFQDEGVAGRDRRAEHPHRDHRGEVERRDASTDADRLAHRIDVDAGARALRIFALQHMRDAAAEFDDVEPALDVAARVGDDRSEEHTSELQSLMRISYAVFCLKKKKTKNKQS